MCDDLYIFFQTLHLWMVIKCCWRSSFEPNILEHFGQTLFFVWFSGMVCSLFLWFDKHFLLHHFIPHSEHSGCLDFTCLSITFSYMGTWHTLQSSRYQWYLVWINNFEQCYYNKTNTVHCLRTNLQCKWELSTSNWIH